MTSLLTPASPTLKTLRVDPEPNAVGTHQRSNPPPPLTSPSKPSQKLSTLLTELCLLSVSLSASFAVARLIQSGFSHSVLLPIFAAVATGGIVAALAARAKLPTVLAAALGSITVVLVTIWSISPGQTLFGLPTLTTLHALSADIHRARAIIGSHQTPVPAVPGVILIATFAAGMVSVLSRTLWEISRRYARFPRPLVLLPPFAMFCYSAPLSAKILRPQSTIFFLLSVLAFLVASDSTRQATSPLHHRNRLANYLPTLLSTATSLLVLLLAAGVLSSTSPSAFPWWIHTSSGSNSTASSKTGHTPGASALAMIANLKATETSSSNIKMFLATSAIPTYWQVGILDTFDGTSWIPGPDETIALTGSSNPPTPPSPTLPPITSTFVSRIDIQNYSGRLLPAPPDTDALTANLNLSVVISDGLGVVIPTLSSPGQYYDLVAQVPSVPPLNSGPTSLDQIYSGLGASAYQYLGLPPSLPTSLANIASSIVGSAKTPLDRAQALVNYFHNGTFVYTLSPPPTPPGQNPLLWFLDSRAGFCQQFAATYAVLARELGLPVRLAIGFTSGLPVSKTDPNQYEITGADAHVWPQVYLGSKLGWVSFEPTPSPPNGEPSAAGIVNARLLSQNNPTGGSTGGPQPILKRRIPLPPIPKTVTPKASTHPAKPIAPLPAGVIVTAILLFLVALAAFVYWRRSKRYVRPAFSFGSHTTLSPDEIVLRSWLRASKALGRAGYQRSQWTTPSSHATFIRSSITDATTGSLAKGTKRIIGEETAAIGVATYGYTELAALAELACYCPGRCTSRDATHAEQEAWRIERALRNSGKIHWLPSRPSVRL